jgi:thiamine-phosphate pyrophosphorylase
MRIVGLSTHSLEQALAAERDGVDYIGVGPVFATATKPGAKPVGVELVDKVDRRVKTPFFAIGGITLGNLDRVLAAGATRVAVVSAILKAPDVTEAAAAFKRQLGSVK